MVKEKDNPDAWIIGIVGASCLVGGTIIGHFVVPTILKLLNPPPPPPKTNPNPPEETLKEEPQKRLGPMYMVEAPPESERIRRIQPKYLHSSAKRGEELRQVSNVPRRSYRFQMQGQQQNPKKTEWRVIE